MTSKMKFLGTRILFFAPILLLCCLLSVPVVAAAAKGSTGQPFVVTGKVSADDRAIAGVVVSDGYSCVTTDAKGSYSIVANPLAEFVFISAPSGYRIAGQAGYGTYPDFYRSIDELAAQRKADFQLEPIAGGSRKFTLVAVGDPQSNEDADIARYERETLGDIRQLIAGQDRPAVAIALGDVVGRGDTESHFKHKQAMGRLGIPFYATIGNHDKDAIDYTGAQFSRALGPRWYSFNVGEVHFVCLDNVDSFDKHEKGARYEAGFSDAQLAWLQQDLAHVGREKMIALFYHIPERDHATHRNHDAIFKLISEFRRAVCFSGHTHYFEPYVNKRFNTTEYILGAACGYFWRSDCGVDGVPNGYAIFEIDGTEITDLYFKGTGLPREEQIRIYRGDDVFGGERATYSYELDSETIVANVFFAGMGGEWKIEVFEDGEFSGEMERMEPLPGDLWIRGYHAGVKSFPFTSSTGPCHHLFKFRLCNPGAEIEVRATDPFGNCYTQTKITRSGDYTAAERSNRF